MAEVEGGEFCQCDVAVFWWIYIIHVCAGGVRAFSDIFDARGGSETGWERIYGVRGGASNIGDNFENVHTDAPAGDKSVFVAGIYWGSCSRDRRIHIFKEKVSFCWGGGEYMRADVAIGGDKFAV